MVFDRPPAFAGMARVSMYGMDTFHPEGANEVFLEQRSFIWFVNLGLV